MVRFNSCEHFHLKSLTGQNYARQSLVTILHTSSWAMLKYIGTHNLIKIYHAVQELRSSSPTTKTGWIDAQQTLVYQKGFLLMPVVR